MIVDLIVDMVGGCMTHGLISLFRGKKPAEEEDSSDDERIVINYDDYKFETDESDSDDEKDKAVENDKDVEECSNDVKSSKDVKCINDVKCVDDLDDDSSSNDFSAENFEIDINELEIPPVTNHIIKYEREERDTPIPRLDYFKSMITFECLTPPDRLFNLRREVTFKMNLGLPVDYFMDTKTVNYCIRNVPAEDIVFIIHTVSYIHHYSEEYDIMQIVAKFETMFRLLRHDASVICNLDIPFIDENDELSEHIITVREWDKMDEFFPDQFIFSKEYHLREELYHLDIHVYLG